MMMLYFPEVPRNLVSITPCILYDLAELGHKLYEAEELATGKNSAGNFLFF